MGHSLIPVPFWDSELRIGTVVSASRETDFYLNRISDLGLRLKFANLYQRDDTWNFVLQLSRSHRIFWLR